MSSQTVALSSAECTACAPQERRRWLRPFSDPIEIPAVSGARGVERGASRWEEEHEEEAGEGAEVVPPHVLLARRGAAFSVCSGQGRTLKGRDLARVRDSVLRMTGFIEG